LDPTFAQDVRTFILSIIYAITGMLLLGLAYRVFDWLTPTNMGDKIFKEGNVAVGVLAGFFLLALAVVIHGAIHG
jgi:uncharacterized membrane protein YjfL (UPF0719 family)